MLKSLDLTYFRKHESKRIDFLNGLNAIRGANEAGKSTLLEAILFALGGSRTLRDPLADTVTWGHKDRELKVVLTMEQDGTEYTFKRSKGGAECSFNGMLITGQDEVTQKASQLLGCDLKMAANLMLSSQSGLRGALEEGPTAVSNMMAKLADVDILDRVLSAATTNLATGADAPLRAKLESTKADLDAHLANPPVDTTAETRQQLEAVVTQAEALRHQVEGPLVQAFDQADLALGRAEAARQAYLRNADGLAKAEVESTRLDQAYTAALTRSADRPSTQQIAAAEAAVLAEQQHAATVALHRRVTGLAYPAEFWDEPVETLHAAIEAAEKDVAAMQAELQALTQTKQAAVAAAQADVAAKEAELRTIQARKITNGKCPTCGSVKNSDEHVAAHNAAVEVDVQVAMVERDRLKDVLAAAQAAAKVYHTDLAPKQAELAELRKVLKDGKPFEDLAAAVEHDERVKVDRSIFPPRTTWIAEVPAAVAGNVAAGQLAALRQKLQTALQAEGQAQAHAAALEKAKVDVANWQTALAETPDVDPAPFTAAREAAWKAYSEANAQLNALRDQADQLRSMLSGYDALVHAFQQRTVALNERIAEIEQELKVLAFNNAFVAKLKAMKPAVTDRLWNTVLAAASNFFSAMRGDTSVISRAGGEFLVNGKSAKSLSGSTLDVMALAIRVALTRTFLPQVSFVSLDEPAHGCDEDRTGNLLGFLSTCGFKQVLLATHDSMSEAVADHVIALGA